MPSIDIKSATKYGEGLHVEYLQPANVPIYSKIIMLVGVSRLYLVYIILRVEANQQN